MSIMTEFVENEGGEAEKQDCERKACGRLLKKLHEEFPHLPVDLSADSFMRVQYYLKSASDMDTITSYAFKKAVFPM